MPNHWHFLLWPVSDEDLANFMQRLTNTHVQRWQQHRHRMSHGHGHQGRFKSFPVQQDEYSYRVLRYIERHALRAALVERARLALVEPFARAILGAGRSLAADPTVALRPGLGGTRQPTASRRGGRSRPAGDPPRLAPGQPDLGQGNCATLGARIHAASTCPPKTISGLSCAELLEYSAYAAVPFFAARPDTKTETTV